jgi:hypothetical protein
MTYTYAILDVSQTTWNEVAEGLRNAGYGHAFDGNIIDMHGIALQLKPSKISPPLGMCPCKKWGSYIGIYDSDGNTQRCYGCLRAVHKCRC